MAYKILQKGPFTRTDTRADQWFSGEDHFSCKIPGLGRGWPVGRFCRTLWIPVFGRNAKNSPENNRAACWCRCGSYTQRVVLNRRKGVEGSSRFVPLRCEIR